MGSIKKKTPLNDPEEWHKLGKMMEAYLEFNMRGSGEPNSKASSGEPNQSKEEETQAISKPPLENKPETDEIEEIEVMAEEGELWVEGVLPNLQEEEDEGILVQVEEQQVQALPAISVVENYIEESRSILVEGRADKQETSTTITLVPLPPNQVHENQVRL